MAAWRAPSSSGDAWGAARAAFDGEKLGENTGQAAGSIPSCPMCGSFEIIDDHAQGDRVCGACGYVVDGSYIDESAEWRNFRDSGKGEDTKDKSRTGAASNHLMVDGGIGTVIGKNGTSNKHIGLQRAQARLNAHMGTTVKFTAVGEGAAAAAAAADPTTAPREVNVQTVQRNLTAAYGEISGICDRLDIVHVIRERACEIFKDAVMKRKVDADGTMSSSCPIRGKGTPAQHGACVFIACRQESAPRTFKEIVSATPKTTRKDVQQAYTRIVKHLEAFEDLAVHRSNHAGDHVRRFCAKLPVDVPQTVLRCAGAVAESLDQLERAETLGFSSRNPATVAATIIWFVVQSYNLQMSAKGTESVRVSPSEIGAVAGVSESTIRTLMKDLVKEADRLLPHWFTGGGGGAGGGAAAVPAAAGAAATPAAPAL